MFKAHTICNNLAELRSVKAQIKLIDGFVFDGFHRNADGTWTADFSCGVPAIEPVDVVDTAESEQWLDELNQDYSNSRGVA